MFIKLSFRLYGQYWALGMGHGAFQEVWEVWEDGEESFPPSLPTLPHLPNPQSPITIER
ncbi:MAG: hypothetical protein RM338_19660 [Nostoc sp. DedQUE12a]|nr:hypothetical protein [Nostoc sp. DedQUE12a]